MNRVVFSLFGFVLAISRVAIPLLIGVILACFLCNIHEGETYSWLSGIWHGMFFVPNFIRSIFDPDILYKATDYTIMYNVYWWIISVMETIMTLPLALFVIITPLVALTTPKKDLEEM